MRGRTPSHPPGEPLEKMENRRIKGERLEVSFPVYARHKGKLIQGFIEALNISWSGMLLATNFPLDSNDQLDLEFTLPEKEIPVSVKAKVVHIIDGTLPEHATRIGVVFEEMDPNVHRMISGFVLENLATD